MWSRLLLKYLNPAMKLFSLVSSLHTYFPIVYLDAFKSFCFSFEKQKYSCQFQLNFVGSICILTGSFYLLSSLAATCMFPVDFVCHTFCLPEVRCGKVRHEPNMPYMAISDSLFTE